MEKQISRKEIYDGKVIHVVCDDIVTDDNIEAKREVVLHNGGACIALKDDSDGKYFLYYEDGGYGEKSWKDMVTSGISMDKSAQKESLEWIRKESLDPNCVRSLACHGIEEKTEVFKF